MVWALLLRKIFLKAYFLLGILVIGCSFSEVSRSDSKEVSTPILGGHLVPYLTVTQIPTLDTDFTTQAVTPNPTDIPLPISTPIIYRVVENDTLTGIAFQHSVSLEDLIAANPGIDPNFLSIGMTLTIPMDGVISAPLPSSTPVSIVIKPPVCYLLLDSSVQCMSVVENDQTYAVENVTVLISLQSTVGNDSNSQIAIMPLNIIPAGQKSAVTATFPSQLRSIQGDSDYAAVASLLSAIPISPNDPRYLQTKLVIQNVVIASDGGQARIMGAIQLLSEQPDVEQAAANVVWVSAFAYDEQNNLVGIRKWVADDILTSGDQANFEFVVYSLGQNIDHVDILTEARP